MPSRSGKEQVEKWKAVQLISTFLITYCIRLLSLSRCLHSTKNDFEHVRVQKMRRLRVVKALINMSSDKVSATKHKSQFCFPPTVRLIKDHKFKKKCWKYPLHQTIRSYIYFRCFTLKWYVNFPQVFLHHKYKSRPLSNVDAFFQFLFFSC